MKKNRLSHVSGGMKTSTSENVQIDQQKEVIQHISSPARPMDIEFDFAGDVGIMTVGESNKLNVN